MNRDSDRSAPISETDLGHIETETTPPTNDLALVSFITGIGGWVVTLLGLCSLGSFSGLCCVGIAVASWIAAVLTGFFAINELNARGENGLGLARTGMAAGFLGLAACLVLLVLIVLTLFGVISLGILDSLVNG